MSSTPIASLLNPMKSQRNPMKNRYSSAASPGITGIPGIPMEFPEGPSPSWVPRTRPWPWSSSWPTFWCRASLLVPWHWSIKLKHPILPGSETTRWLLFFLKKSICYFKKNIFLVSDFDLNLPRSIRVFEASLHERKSGEVLPVQPVPCNGRNNMISHDISQDNDIVWWCLMHVFTLSHCALLRFIGNIWRFEDGGSSIYSTGPTLGRFFSIGTSCKNCAVYSFGPWSPCPRVAYACGQVTVGFLWGMAVPPS